jgi:hypothetical protein
MASVIADRLTAQVDGEVVVFLIGMRINRFWKIHKWLPVALAMPRLLRELEAAPESGFLGGESWLGNPTIALQYWRSFEEILSRVVYGDLIRRRFSDDPSLALRLRF